MSNETRRAPLRANFQTLTIRTLLLAAGFKHLHGGTFAGDSLTASISGRWLSIEADLSRWKNPGIGRPGLWARRDKRLACFEIPTGLVMNNLELDDEETVPSAEELVEWCEAALVGGEPVGWTPPEEAELRGLLPAKARTIQHGRHVRKLELIDKPTRNALRVELVPKVPAGMSIERQAWLARLVESTNERRRMLRLGFEDTGKGLAVVAEVDFTGCPPHWRAELVELGAAALRHVTADLLATLQMLCDPHAARCEAWESSPD